MKNIPEELSNFLLEESQFIHFCHQIFFIRNNRRYSFDSSIISCWFLKQLVIYFNGLSTVLMLCYALKVRELCKLYAYIYKILCSFIQAFFFRRLYINYSYLVQIIFKHIYLPHRSNGNEECLALSKATELEFQYRIKFSVKNRTAFWRA